MNGILHYSNFAVAVAVWAETSQTTDPTQVIHDGVQVVGELGLAFHSWLGLDCCVSRLFGCSLVGGFSGVLVGGYIVVTCDFRLIDATFCFVLA